MHLKQILSHASNWTTIHQWLIKQPNNGQLFELLCKYYYLTDPEYKNVFLSSEITTAIKDKLGLNGDRGVDLVLESHDGKLTTVQCKFKSNQNEKLYWSKDSLTNFFADSNVADELIIFTNASGIDKHSANKYGNKLRLVSFSELSDISQITMQNMYAMMCGTKTKPRKKILPRDDQNIAIRKVIDGFSSSDKGQLILPCGTGKTLVALWIKEAMKSMRTLFLVPSLGLLSQVKKAWTLNNNSSEFTPYICVCSAKDIDKDDDNIMYAYEINGRVSTNVDEVKSFLLQHKKMIIYSTYQSLHIVAAATKELDFIFDLAICDEAHKTIGSKKSKFSLVHDNNAICIKKRLYMTATPRVLSKTRENYHDMSDVAIFGNEFHYMSFKEAITQGILVDYKIAVIGVSDEEILTAIHNKALIPGLEDTVFDRVHHYALNKFMQKIPVTHVISFHSSVNNAKSFSEKNKIFFPEIDTYHVNGSQSTKKRRGSMSEFENSERAIITNARCLTEGIDVPAIDAVYFCEPKRSKIDIVQAAGRALRKADEKGKKMGYIVVPILHSSNYRDAETASKEIAKNTPFENLISIIHAMMMHDTRLIDMVNDIQSSKERRAEIIKNFVGDDNIIFFDGFDSTKLRESLTIHLLDNMCRCILPLTEEQIIKWLQNHYDHIGEWPRRDSEHLFKLQGDSWSKIDTALREGLRGLPGGSSLAQLLKKYFGVGNIQSLPQLSIEEIKNCILMYKERTNEWPNEKSGSIPELPGETWAKVMSALHKGGRGLPGGSSLAKLSQDLGKRNPKNLPKLTIEQISQWAEAHHKRTGEWPTKDSGSIPEVPGENWKAINYALKSKKSIRGLRGSTTLSLLLKEQLGVGLFKFDISTIKKCILTHVERIGAYPDKHSGVVFDLPGKTWGMIDSALRKGNIELADKSNLAKLISTEFRVRNIKYLPDLEVEIIKKCILAYHKSTNEWPDKHSGKIPELPGETWSSIDSALYRGKRGLYKSSLAKLREQLGGRPNHYDLPNLTKEIISRWAQLYFNNAGKWPNEYSGLIEEASYKITWRAVNAALRQGLRGLSSGSSLSKFISKELGKCNDLKYFSTAEVIP